MSRFFENMFAVYTTKMPVLKAGINWWSIGDDNPDPLPDIESGKIRVAVDPPGNKFILIGTPKGTVVFMLRKINEALAVLNSNLSKVSIGLASHVLVDNSSIPEEVLRSIYSTCVV